MAREYTLPPSAAALSSSLRDLGYSLETAIADLIDNSISADASECQIFYNPTQPEPSLTILDNGDGMTRNELIDAMRHGTKALKYQRAPDDLGKFGLGLKTASFSQCERMTVVSRKNEVLSGAEWDLRLVSSKDDWMITLLEEESEMKNLPFIDHLQGDGTMVVWRAMDRLLESGAKSPSDEIVYEKMDGVEKHLALVFHRFLAGEIKSRKRLSISINGHPVEAFDPFCRKNEVTQLLPPETVSIGKGTVHIQPYILPHHSKLSPRDYHYYQSRSDFVSNQGMYIYRNGRLMAWGDWFRLIPKGEKTKLARVQVDFSSSLDKFWEIDIKKSRVKLPVEVRERLRQIIDKIVERSVSIYRQRGKKIFEESETPVWERYAGKDRIHYSINQKHPLIQMFAINLDENQRDKFNLILQSIASALPVDTLYSDYSINPKDVQQSEIPEDSVINLLDIFVKELIDSGEKDIEKLKAIIHSTQLFKNHWHIVEEFMHERMQ